MTREPPWPNLFVVGANRAGTTSLWRYLGEHPEIFMTRFKEPHFFSGHRSPLYPSIHDEAAYLRLFADARTPLRGEASTSYLGSEAAPERIQRVSPDARIVIAVRDPVERAHSRYWGLVRTGREHASFAAAVASELEPGFPVERSTYAWKIQYAADVTRYMRVFGANVRVVVLEELVRDPRRVLGELFAFLGVDPRVADRIPTEPHNAFAVPHARFAVRLLGSARVRAVARTVVPFALRGPIESRLLRTRPKPPIDTETDRRLTAFFAPDVHRLTTLLGRALPWPRWPDAFAESAAAPPARIAG